MKKSFIIFGLAALFTACNNGSEDATPQNEANTPDQQDTTIAVVENEIIPLDSFFKPIDTSFLHHELIVPEGFNIQILFTEKEDMVVRADGQSFPAKGNHDMLAFIPDDVDPNKGWIYVSHETRRGDANLGDGGGGTIFQVEKDSSNNWTVLGDFNHIDFTTVGNTQRNCGGILGPNGMIYTCEEIEPQNNNAMAYNGKGHTNLDSIGNLAYWQNFGYIVEVDPKTRKATKKIFSMGRFYHEDLEFMDDKKTVYLSDDHEPGAFFKFVADTPGDYEFGQLYAFKEGNDSVKSQWLAIPRDTASMINARNEAMKLGASMYIRHEWFVRSGSKIYISETGHDEDDCTPFLKMGASFSKAILPHTQGNVFQDVHGRILVFDTETNEMSNYLECGFSKDSSTVISNPDCLSIVNLGGQDYLMIHEDLNGADKGRIPDYAKDAGRYHTELYFLDLSIENPTIEDLKRFAIGPDHAELTGGIVSPDGSTLFLNVMHPKASNGPPYNRSMTVAITGW